MSASLFRRKRRRWKLRGGTALSRSGRRLYGTAAFFLIALAFLVALWSTLSVSLLLGAAYFALLVTSALLICRSYCSKCTCKLNGCAFVFPAIVAVFLPKRASGPYTRRDHLGAVLPFGLLLLLPQFWLWRQRSLMALFWGLVLFAFLEIRVSVCPECENEGCPFHSKGTVRTSRRFVSRQPIAAGNKSDAAPGTGGCSTIP